MSKLYTGDIGFSVAIKQTGALPLDDRAVVQTFDDLLDPNTFGLSTYNGMIVSVIDNKQAYMLIDKTNSSSASAWAALGGEITGSTEFIDIQDTITAHTETLNQQYNLITGNTEDIERIDGVVSGLADNVSVNTKSIETISETLQKINDTKNTAGSSNSEQKLYLIGATEQNADGIETYSNSKIYISGDTIYIDNKNVALNDDVLSVTTSLTTLSGTVNDINNVVTGHADSISDLTKEIETIKDGTYSFDKGLNVSGNTVNVLIAETDNYLKINDSNELIVTGVTTDDTVVSEEITIEGGPLASIAKQVYTDGKVPEGTSIQQFLKNLLCVEIYPTTTSSAGSFSLTLSSPSITANVSTGSLVEVGKSITINAVTAKSVSPSVTNPKVSGFKHGYSDTVDGTINTSTSITETITYAQKSGSVYTLTASKSGFVGTTPTSVSNAASGSCSLASATFTASLGTNKYTVSETGPVYTYSYPEIGNKYIVSNLGGRSESKKSTAVSAKSTTDSNTPSSSASYSVTGVYPVYTNISGSALIADASTKQSLQTSATFTFTSVPGEVGSNPFMFDFPSTKSISSFQMKDPSGNWVNFSAAYTTDTTVTKTINGNSYTYKRLKTDGTQGAGNTYKIVLNSALNA